MQAITRRRLAYALLALGSAWLLVLLAAAASGGWDFGAVTVKTSRPLRFALMALFAGWFLLPLDERERLVARLGARRLLLGALGFAVVWGLGFRITRWLAFETGAFDLSLFESTLHYTLRGELMHAWGLGRSLFSEHFEPIVLFHLPLWLPFKHPLVLLFSQQLAVTLAVVPLYRAARALGLASRFAGFIGAAYLLNSVVWQSNHMDFHPELFGPLALFWALHASISRRWVSFYAAVLFSLCLKEEMALVLLCFSVLVLKGPGERRWPHALVTAAVAIAWGVVAFKLVMPAAHPSPPELHPIAVRWTHLGSTYPEMLLSLLSRPLWLLGLLFHEGPLWLFASVGFVPLLDPVSFLAALPPLFLHLTGSYAFAARLAAYYGIFPATLLVAGLVFSMERAHRRWGERGAVIAGILPLLFFPTWGFFARPKAADLHAMAFIRAIPQGDVVCAQSPLAPHRVPFRETLQLVPECEAPAWVLFAKDSDIWPLTDRAEYEAVVQQYLSQGYAPQFAEGEFLFLKRSD